MISAEEIKALMSLNSKRAAGNWYTQDENRILSACEVDDTKEGWDRVISDYVLIDSEEAPNLEPDDIAFIAAAPTMIQAILTLQTLLNRAADRFREIEFASHCIAETFNGEVLSNNARLAQGCNNLHIRQIVSEAAEMLEPYLRLVKEGE